jgi:hypothetical protein
MLGRHCRDEGREHTLGEPHMQPPQADAKEEHDERLAEAEQEIGRDQNKEHEDQEWLCTDPVLPTPG